MTAPDLDGYTKDELYSLWTGFREQPGAAKLLSEFALCNREEAQRMIAGFEISFAAQALGSDGRGKEDRQRRHV